MCKVADGTSMFSCKHRWSNIGFGYLCKDCAHFRLDLPEPVTERALIFFPSNQFIPQDLETSARALP